MGFVTGVVLPTAERTPEFNVDAMAEVGPIQLAPGFSDLRDTSSRTDVPFLG